LLSWPQLTPPCKKLRCAQMAEWLPKPVLAPQSLAGVGGIKVRAVWLLPAALSPLP